jgi:hypothetical protein
MTHQQSEIDFLSMESALVLFCPYCTHESFDDFDVLDPDVLDKMRCESCKKEFSFALMECHRCAHEQTFSWKKEPPATALDLLTCSSCDSTFRYPNAYQEGQPL